MEKEKDRQRHRQTETETEREASGYYKRNFDPTNHQECLAETEPNKKWGRMNFKFEFS